MTTDTWTFDADTGGRLTIETGVTGKAAKMGHRLTIAVESWTATVDRSAGAPTAVELTAELESLNVVKGEGGLTPLVGPEKIVAKANALKTLDARRYPRIRFSSNVIVEDEEGFLVSGDLEIHGVTKPVEVRINVEDSESGRTFSSETVLRQTDYGISPYSQMFGTMKVVDEVTVSFDAEYRKSES